MARLVLRAVYRLFLQRRRLLPSTVAEATHVWPRSRLSLMVAGHVPQGSARPSACWFLPSPCASRRRRGPRSSRRSSKTSWRRSSRCSSSSSCRSCSSSLFWMVHILPEKIAHKRHHPQFEAIRTLCLLSLVFGGLLWPIAWLWAYSKPVLHKMAYGTDKARHGSEDDAWDDATELHQRLARLAATRHCAPRERRRLRADLTALARRPRRARSQVRRARRGQRRWKSSCSASTRSSSG